MGGSTLKAFPVRTADTLPIQAAPNQHDSHHDSSATIDRHRPRRHESPRSAPRAIAMVLPRWRPDQKLRGPHFGPSPHANVNRCAITAHHSGSPPGRPRYAACRSAAAERRPGPPGRRWYLEIEAIPAPENRLGEHQYTSQKTRCGLKRPKVGTRLTPSYQLVNGHPLVDILRWLPTRRRPWAIVGHNPPPLRAIRIESPVTLAGHTVPRSWQRSSCSLSTGVLSHILDHDFRRPAPGAGATIQLSRDMVQSVDLSVSST